jgi:hypothetical protein
MLRVRSEYDARSPANSVRSLVPVQLDGRTERDSGDHERQQRAPGHLLAARRTLNHEDAARAAFLGPLHGLPVCLCEQGVACHDTFPEVRRSVRVRRIERVPVALPDQLVLALDFFAEPLPRVLR